MEGREVNINESPAVARAPLLRLCALALDTCHLSLTLERGSRPVGGAVLLLFRENPLLSQSPERRADSARALSPERALWSGLSFATCACGFGLHVSMSAL
jgi:hypothetical protein